MNTLPPELKEQILLDVDNYKKVVRVSSEWKHIAKNSKKILQKELDNYFFFYVIWDCYYSVDHSIGDHPAFFFPIVTEEQHETSNSQVAALEKNKYLPQLLFNSSWSSEFFLCPAKLTLVQKDLGRRRGLTLGDTETLIEKIRSSNSSETIFQYSRALYRSLRNAGFESGVHGLVLQALDVHFLIYRFFTNVDMPWLLTQKTPKFSNVEEMADILAGEHIVFRLVDEYSVRVVMPHSYDKFKKIMQQTRKRKKRKWPHAGVARSLFLPRWAWPSGKIEETDEDFASLAWPDDYYSNPRNCSRQL